MQWVIKDRKTGHIQRPQCESCFCLYIYNGMTRPKVAWWSKPRNGWFAGPYNDSNKLAVPSAWATIETIEPYDENTFWRDLGA